VRLHLPEALTRRVQGDGRGLGERVEIGEPSLRVRHAVRNDDEETARQLARERGHEHRVARAGEARDIALRAGRGQRCDELAERRKLLKRVEQPG
jgi:hypothetical protein